jgi:hypothetical protein
LTIIAQIHKFASAILSMGEQHCSPNQTLPPNLDIKKIYLRQKSSPYASMPCGFFLDKFSFCLRLVGKV